MSWIVYDVDFLKMYLVLICFVYIVLFKVVVQKWIFVDGYVFVFMIV